MDCGITLVAFGAEKYVIEAVASAKSYRAKMPDVPIALVTNAHVTGAHAFDHIVNIEEEPVSFPQRFSGFYQKIVGIAHSPFAVTLFVDGDTYCCEPVYDLFSAARQHGLVAVHAPYKIDGTQIRDPAQHWNVMCETNTGVLAFDKGRLGVGFFDLWKELYRRHVPSEEGYFSDQSIFRLLLGQLKITPFYMTVEYNLRIGLPNFLHGPVRILHGRPRSGFEGVERFVNSSVGLRAYLPSTGLLVLDPQRHEWELRRFPSGAAVQRINLIKAFDLLASEASAAEAAEAAA
jgi:hypothetical protein